MKKQLKEKLGKIIIVILNLSDKEILDFIKMNKYVLSNKIYEYPSLGLKINIDLISKDKTNSFFLDINSNRYKLNKYTFQNRVKDVIQLLRLDINSSPRRNPDGTEIGRTHLHIYSAKYNDKVAYELNNIPTNFSKIEFDTFNIINTLNSFMNCCNIVKKPKFMQGLFSK